MSELFLTILNMSLTASYVIIFVILVRLLLKKAPKVISYALWGVVAFRLIIPFSFESIFSLLPRNTNTVPIPHDIFYQQIPQINSGIKVVDSFVSESLPAPTVGASANPLQIYYMEIGAYIWILGIMILLIYSLVSVLLLKRQLKSAQLIEQNIFEAKNLKTPFVLGLIRPKIYLPVGLKAEERNYILLHEQTHIHRKDHIIKILSFLILSIHWFNPLVWIAFMLMSMDMELSCDERVLKETNEDIKKPYANSLLLLAIDKHILNGSPLAFGEGTVKERIKNVLNYKKPRFWIIFFSIIFGATIGIGLIANPKSFASFNGSSYRVKEILYQAPMYSFGYILDTAPQYSISSDYMLYSKQITDEDWIMHDGLYRYEISRQELYTLFNPLSNNVHEAIDQTELIYRTYTEDDNQTFYLVMQLKNGDVLLALGYNSKDNRLIRWLFRLEKLSDSNGKAADINLHTKDVNNDDQITSFAWEFINKDIVNYESNPEVNIIDSKITWLELIETFNNLADAPIDVYALEYRLLPEDLSKVVLAGGMDVDGEGWLKEASSMGRPLFI
jgi:beta-lactamase regulating signal transducer with metallopeptidase domain